MSTKIIPSQNQYLSADLPPIPKKGEIKEAKIVGMQRSKLYLDLSPVGTGIIEKREFLNAKNTLRKFNKGDVIKAKIIGTENKDGYIEMSFNEANRALSWDDLESKKQDSETISVRILGANKGGLLTEINGIPGFIPVSQLSSEHYPRVEEGNKTEILRKLQKLIGQEIKVKIITVSKKEDKLILSEKASNLPEIKEVLKDYKEGDIVEGIITGITDFGAFIKFPAETPKLEGLIHISEFDWKLIKNPKEVVKIGQKIKAKIIKIDNQERIFLSLKALKKDPWLEAEKKLKKGAIIKGTITKINPFGAFVQVAPEIQGLAHISEFQSAKEMEALKEGKNYKFKIISIDPQEHRLSLKFIPKD